MEGIPARSSTAGLMILYSRFGQNHTRKTAQRMPSGTPTIIAPAVTYTLPTIIGKMPYILFPGFHVFPRRKSATPILPMAGTPLANRNIQINPTARMDTAAAAMNTHFITASFISFPPSYPGTLLLCSGPICQLACEDFLHLFACQIINLCCLWVYHNCDTIHRNHCRGQSCRPVHCP